MIDQQNASVAIHLSLPYGQQQAEWWKCSISRTGAPRGTPIHKRALDTTGCHQVSSVTQHAFQLFFSFGNRLANEARQSAVNRHRGCHCDWRNYRKVQRDFTHLAKVTASAVDIPPPTAKKPFRWNTNLPDSLIYLFFCVCLFTGSDRLRSPLQNLQTSSKLPEAIVA